MSGFTGLGRLLIIFGAVLVVTGLLVLGLGKFTNLGRLPGDILIKKGNLTFFFPLVTCILLSLVLTLIINLITRR